MEAHEHAPVAKTVEAKGTPSPGWAKLWGLSLGAATVLGLSGAAVAYVGIQLSGVRKISPGAALAMSLPDWYFWALVAPPAVYLALRFPIDRSRWLRHAGLHAGVGTVVAAAELAIFAWVFRALEETPGFPTYGSYYFYIFGLWFHYQFGVYWLIVLATHSFDYYRRYRERQVKAVQLETELMRAQLDALRRQIQPHFLFNSLNTIAMLMRERKVEAATDMIARLGDLLREFLDRGDSQEVELREELKLTRDYLSIEQARFGDRLRVRFDVAEDALGALVPNMLLQPLVENAVRHGVARRSGTGHIDVEAHAADGRLLLHVQDDGPGLSSTPDDEHNHLGLANTRRRLQTLYGDRGSLEVGNGRGGGAAVTVSIPLRGGPSRAAGAPA